MRYSPDSLGYVIKGKSDREDHHARRRLAVSQAVLTTLLQLVLGRDVPWNAEITAVGATLQAPKSNGRAGYQDAHQVLRELSVDGIPLYLIESLSEQEARVLLYCHAAVSNIPQVYNEADGLVETHIRGPFVELARWMMEEARKRELMFFRASRQFLQRDTWEHLLNIFIVACRAGIADDDCKDGQAAVLRGYIADATALADDARTLLPRRSQEIYKRGVADWYRDISAKVEPKQVQVPGAGGRKAPASEQERLRLRKKLREAVLSDRG